jgi:hypothetical protein
VSAADGARPRLAVERLPRHAPGPNEIERSWRDPNRRHLARRTSRDALALDAAIRHAVQPLDRERRAAACAVVPKAA